MYNSQVSVADVTKAWKILIAVFFLTISWQYYAASANAGILTHNKIEQVQKQVQQAPAPLEQKTPEQLKQQQLTENYNQASFLSVVETNDKIRYSNDDLFCMAKNIYHEAGSEPTLGKYAVAQVTINRIKAPQYGDRVCSVVFEPYQFSWANNRSRRWTQPSGPSWQEAKRIARDVLENGKRIKGMDDVLFYHATYVRPNWSYRKDRLTKIGLHIFYEPRGV